MHLAPLIRDLAVILAVAGLVSLIFQRLKQPVVLGYILAGIIVGPYALPTPLVRDIQSIQTWAELGVIFLMFSLGLEFSFRKLVKVGLSPGLTAVIEVLCMTLIGFLTGRLLKWSYYDSLFLGAMISISSTTIIVKSLTDLKLKTRRFAEMILGILIVEDLMAILILVTLSTFATSHAFSGFVLIQAAAKLGLVISAWFLTGYFLLPRFTRYVGRVGSDEMLTIIVLGLCLSLVVFADYFGYSVALGAFIMGSILSESTESHRIEERIEPLRDLFVAVFFVSIGMLINPITLITQWKTILLISVVVTVSKTLVTTLAAMITGQTLRTSVQVGFGLARIGEFSFIIAGLGVSLGVTQSFLYPIAVAVAILTTFTTPPMIRHSHRFAVWFEGKLPLRMREVLVRYVAWTQERRADAVRRQEFYQILFRWLVNGVLISVIFVVAAEWLLPMVDAQHTGALGVRFLVWALAMICSAPFIWAMLVSFRRFKLANPVVGGVHPPTGGTLFLTRLLTVLWLGLLSFEFFPVRFVILSTVLVATALLVLFYRQLESSYIWFEQRFLANFEPVRKTRSQSDMMRHLAPWDAHLVRIKVHPNAEIATKRLSESQLRSRFGLNVVAIQRGLKTIVAPKPEELILPKDELLVLGVDDQIEIIRPEIEKPPGLADRYQHLSAYELRHLRIDARCALVGKTIRDSGIREQFSSMVVGLERGNQRMINPDSDLVIQAEDVLWVVGEYERLNKLEEYFSGEGSALR